MTHQKSVISGALTGAALALVFVTWPVNAKPMDPPPPQWLECVKHGEGECASGGDDTISWAEAEYDLRIIQDWANRSLHYRSRLPSGSWLGFKLPGQWWADYVAYPLTIRRAAIEAGYPPDALRLMLVGLEANGVRGRHAVLVVYTDDAGPMVFDPLRARTLCHVRECQRRTLKVWALEEYAALPGVVPLAIYEPGGTWRFMDEFWVEDTVTP